MSDVVSRRQLVLFLVWAIRNEYRAVAHTLEALVQLTGGEVTESEISEALRFTGEPGGGSARYNEIFAALEERIGYHDPAPPEPWEE
jgi:hypothetical protein